MLVSDIIDEVQEITGTTDQTVNFRAITRGIEVLANKGLYDPLIGYLDFFVNQGYEIALPADVKTPLRLNLNGNPAFSRSRLFEFALNTDGTYDGPGIGWTWDNRLYACVQDARPLPGQISYLASNAADNGSQATVYGTDANGREIRAVLTASASAPVPSAVTFQTVTRVLRAATQFPCTLEVGSAPIAQYYAWETQPSYRVIRLSQTGVAVRMMYRRHVFKITALTDVIMLQSATAVILATRAARSMQLNQFDQAGACAQMAVEILNEEQASRQESEAIAKDDVVLATNRNISCRDSVIAADVYDDACTIMGSIGREQIFDELTTAIEVLANKTQWDPLIGFCDIFKSANWSTVNPQGPNLGSGYFVLPRYVETLLAVNLMGRPGQPRNGWFEYHLNGTGERDVAGCAKWDDLGEVVTINQIPLSPAVVSHNTHLPIPQGIVAVPDSELDNGLALQVYGEDQNGREVCVTPPCTCGSYAVDGTQPLIIRVTRVVKPLSVGCIRLIAVGLDSAQTLLGYYYPDELEPKYRAIRLASKSAVRIRVRYRKRWRKITSLFDPMHLRSRLAITSMLRALKAQYAGDAANAVNYETLAVNYLAEERIAMNPTESLSLQFDTGTSPAHTHNIS